MSSNTYAKLISQCPALSICSYGNRSNALGMEGSAESIRLMHNLVYNYAGPCALYRLSDTFAYLTLPADRLRAAIKLYLYVNLLHSGEVPSTQTWDETEDTYTLSRDEEAAERLAVADAETFMASLPTRSFLPTERPTPSYEYQFAA